MQCPNCNVALIMTDRQGVEIDYCPQCRGVWLDRGELDKIIERSATLSTPAPERETRSAPAPPPGMPYGSPPRRDYDDDDDDDHRYRGGHGDYRRKKKRGFLGELFDFD